jgi:hypothetical protein
MRNYKGLLFQGFLRLLLVWVLFAFTFQVTMLFLSIYNPPLEQKISNEVYWAIDGTFSK